VEQVGTEVLLGRDGVVVLLDLLIVGVDGDIPAAEVLQASRMVQVQMTQDDGPDFVDAVPGGFERLVEVMLLFVRAHREQVPDPLRPFVLRVLYAPGVEQDRAGGWMLDHRRADHDAAALVVRMRGGLCGGVASSDEVTVIDVHPAEVEERQFGSSHVTHLLWDKTTNALVRCQAAAMLPPPSTRSV
jgi:hypothetical protein